LNYNQSLNIMQRQASCSIWYQEIELRTEVLFLHWYWQLEGLRSDL